ncbi:MAG: hypothetical protein R6V04_10610 [bacterium]
MHSRSNQEDLFDVSKTNDLQYKVRELDKKIHQSLKNNDYQKAKELTDLQKEYIQELVSLSENK